MEYVWDLEQQLAQKDVDMDIILHMNTAHMTILTNMIKYKNI